jgi:hypothetical protein
LKFSVFLFLDLAALDAAILATALLPPTGRARAEVLDLVVLNLELQSILNFTSRPSTTG